MFQPLSKGPASSGWLCSAIIDAYASQQDWGNFASEGHTKILINIWNAAPDYLNLELEYT